MSPSRRRRPLPVQDAIADRVVFPLQFAALDFDRDERRRLRRRDVDVALILPVARAAIEQPAIDHRRAVGEVVRERSDFFHHVEDPDDVDVGLAGQLFVLVGAVVFAVVKPLDVGGDDLAAVRGEVCDAPHDRGRAGDTLVGPIVGAAGRELFERRLPHELAGVLIERHQHAAIAGLLRIAHGFVVGADHHDAVRDCGIAV